MPRLGRRRPLADPGLPQDEGDNRCGPHRRGQDRGQNPHIEAVADRGGFGAGQGQTQTDSPEGQPGLRTGGEGAECGQVISRSARAQ